MNRFLDLADFSRDEVVDLIALARRLETHPEPQALAGRILAPYVLEEAHVAQLHDALASLPA